MKAITFSKAMELHAQHLRAARRSPKTLTWYGEQLTAYQRWAAVNGLGDALPTDVDLDIYLSDQHELGLKPSTVHGRYRALRGLLRFLERRRYLTPEENPARLTEAPTVPKEIRRHVTPQDFDTLYQSIGARDWVDWRDRLILLLLFYSGVRVGELCGLKVSDVDAAQLQIKVMGKGSKERLVPMHEEAGRVFAGYLYSRPQHSEALFLTSDGYDGAAGVLQREGVRQMLIRRCKRAGIAVYNPHAFRHGFAMWMLNAGVRATTVATAMGHSDPQITLAIYAHTQMATVRREYDEALKRLGK